MGNKIRLSLSRKRRSSRISRQSQWSERRTTEGTASIKQRRGQRKDLHLNLKGYGHLKGKTENRWTNEGGSSEKKDGTLQPQK